MIGVLILILQISMVGIVVGLTFLTLYAAKSSIDDYHLCKMQEEVELEKLNDKVDRWKKVSSKKRNTYAATNKR